MSNIIANQESDTQKISFQSPPNKKSDNNIHYRTRDMSPHMENIEPMNIDVGLILILFDSVKSISNLDIDI